MQCIHCGFELPGKVKFCRKCGKVQQVAPEVSAPVHFESPAPPEATASTEPAVSVDVPLGDPILTVPAPAPPTVSTPVASAPIRISPPATPPAEVSVPMPAAAPVPRAGSAPATPAAALATPLLSRTALIASVAVVGVLVTGGGAYLAGSSQRNAALPAVPQQPVSTVPTGNPPPAPLPAPGQPLEPMAQPVAPMPVTADAKQRLNAMLKAANQGAWETVDASIQAINMAIPRRAGNPEKAKPLNDQAIAAIGRADYASAIPLLVAAVELDQGNPEIRNNLGYAQLRSRDMAEAKKNVGTSLELGPSRAAAWANMAEILAETDNPDAAQSALRIALYLAKNRDRVAQALGNPETFPSEKFRSVIGVVLPAIGSIPTKP